MKKIIILLFLISILFLSGCQTREVTKYVCQDGTSVSNLDDCSSTETSEGADESTSKVQREVTPQPEPTLEIVSDSSYIDDNGWMHIIGEVKNKGNIEARYVKIIITLYDENENIVGGGYTYVEGTDVPTGQTRPFGKTFTDKIMIAKVDSYKLNLDYLD